MKYPGKMWLLIILKVTKNQGFTLSVEDTFFEKVPITVFNPYQPSVAFHIEISFYIKFISI